MLASSPPNDLTAVTPFDSLIRAGSLNEARPVLEQYVIQNPGSWRAQYQLGYVYFRLHMIEQSVASLCKSLVINTTFAESHKILAYDLNILGDPDRAVLELQRAIQIDQNSTESHYELGRIYYEKGSYLQAIEELETAKHLSPEFVRSYHNLGLAYAAVSDRAKAVENFKEGLRLNEKQARKSAWPLIDYATYCNQQDDFTMARTLLLQSILLEPKEDQAFQELSKAYRGLGLISEAIAALQRAISLNNLKPEYHYALAQLYKQDHQLIAAQEQLSMYRQARSKIPSR